ncbi:class C beta-lactamase [Chitinivorax sp. B]|uniref:class C beta-lactamase n=1 Tax=Chitinivorax sp. B TaxID=2502235 RepID=UPI0010F75190|nr:class C beta-lactamase [Chitinivorax sp. B]
MKPSKWLPLLTALFLANSQAADNTDPANLQDTIVKAIQPIIQQYAIPGMAVAVTVDGKHTFHYYGVASKDTQQPISSDTLFEIGSISKTFTATLAAYASDTGKLSFSDTVSKHLPALQGSQFDNISLLHLATHTAGSLPLQVPDKINHIDQLTAYLKRWQSDFAAGTHRNYSNVSIGLLGLITAKSLNQSFESAMSQHVFSKLGLTNTYITVPTAKMRFYAQGYTKADQPIRLQPGLLGTEAYSMKASAADMIRFVDANMQVNKIDTPLQRAIDATHTGYFKSGDITQDLIWEQYPYPVKLEQLQSGNGDTMIFNANPATQLTPPQPPTTNALINKTGSTNGFAAYVAYIPARKIGIVILANKSYPIAPRLIAANKILTRLDSMANTGR